ncbi:DUF1510 family protein [Shouchella lonarensis]|uniref:DUF1510 domain-containing protein n=1 Tax=Shouchella lonarensis TaxID=1464122 RepID=A0A1G6JJR6_9BACI|nr:DUF1510 family protein [Shouchella lonarensis]SDC18989.1 Protein of unknown function [Shouchella lonarensis]
MSKRYENRKSRRINRLLNIAIAVVSVLIVVLGVTLVTHWMSSNTQQASNNEPEKENNGPALVEDGKDEDKQASANVDARAEEEEEKEKPSESEETEEEKEEEEETTSEEKQVETAQENPTPNDFTMGSQNWNEMEEAVYLGTNLRDGVNGAILWRLENGGSSAARAVISAAGSHDTPQEVQLKWVDGVGWEVTSVEQMTSNPYR